jgi:PAS domain S-box-containing protein
VAITDQKGIIKHVNENFCKISKYSREELLGQDHRIINSGFHPKEFIRNLWVTIANGKIWRGELKNKAKDGSYYWVDTTIVPFLNEQGKPYQYLAIRSDITSRKAAEEELLKNKQELEKKVVERTLELTEALSREKELNEMKSRFVSMASHEFRTPLSAILSSTSLLDHYTSEEQAEKRAKHIDRIKTSVKNLTAILDDFLSLEKLEHGKVEVHSIEFHLKDFIQDVIDEMDGMLKKKNQKVIFSYKGENEICQDKKILRNVLLNILSNAVKYSPEEKEIYVTAEVVNDIVKISVKDEGIGIPAEAQKDLFGKFFRARNVSNIQGTGLGLNIVKRYVELIDGHISFVSREGKGTTFTIEFPQRRI